MKYFTIEELCASSVARSKGLDNFPGPDAATHLRLLVTHVLDPVRELNGGPLRINSGYRCPELNKAVGGATNSQHISGQAADITTGSREGNKLLFDKISGSTIPFDQLIDESGYSWIHISYGPRNRHQILQL